LSVEGIVCWVSCKTGLLTGDERFLGGGWEYGVGLRKGGGETKAVIQRRPQSVADGRAAEMAVARTSDG